MQFNKPNVMALTFSTLFAISGVVYASGSHQHSHGQEEDGHQDSTMSSMSEQIGEMFLIKKQIDGYDVSFHVMKARPGKKMGGSHDFMIKVEKDGKALTNVVMNTKVAHPNGQTETKKAMKMGEWLMTGYDLGHEGKHQMMVLFKTADGKKHKGGVYYPGK